MLSLPEMCSLERAELTALFDNMTAGANSSASFEDFLENHREACAQHFFDRVSERAISIIR